jgi:hypothetical protein
VSDKYIPSANLTTAFQGVNYRRTTEDLRTIVKWIIIDSHKSADYMFGRSGSISSNIGVYFVFGTFEQEVIHSGAAIASIE